MNVDDVDNVDAWLGRTRTASGDHHLPHDADRASLRRRLRDALVGLGLSDMDRDAAADVCAGEMARLFAMHAGGADEALDRLLVPRERDGRTLPVVERIELLADRCARAAVEGTRDDGAGSLPITREMAGRVREELEPTLVAPAAPTATYAVTTAVQAATQLEPAPPRAADADEPNAPVGARAWARRRWRRLHWASRAALVVLGPPTTLLLGLAALCTVSPPVGAAVLGTTNRVFDRQLYGHDFVDFGNGRFETTPWQFTFMHPKQAAMDGLREQCERGPDFAPPVCRTVEHSYRLVSRPDGTYTKKVDADNERAWFEHEACPSLAKLDHHLYDRNLDAGWARYKSHGCVPYES